MKEFLIIYFIGVIICSIIVYIITKNLDNFKDSSISEELDFYQEYKHINNINPFIWIYFCLLSWFMIFTLIYMYVTKKYKR